jgi:GcrA cell cycle regulator
MSAATWTEAQLDRLRELAEAHQLSCAEMGRELGKTKNSIVGKMRRLGINKLSSASAAFVDPKRTTQPPAKSEPKASPYRPPSLPTMGILECVHLLDVTHNQCRWPHSDDYKLCCGRSIIKGYPYCAAHVSVGHQLPKKKNTHHDICY